MIKCWLQVDVDSDSMTASKIIRTIKISFSPSYTVTPSIYLGFFMAKRKLYYNLIYIKHFVLFATYFLLDS
jgi:hypothetical protein